MTKILYIITQSEFGGAQRYVFDLATNLDKSKYTIEIAIGGNKGELFHRLKAQNLATHRIKHLIRSISPINDVKAYFEIKKLIRYTKPDIVHLNSSKAGVLGSMAAKNLKIKKIIYTVHGFVFNEPMHPIKLWLYKKIELGNAKRVNSIITVSEHDKQSGINMGIDEKKLTTIHNGIDFDNSNFLTKEEARLKLSIDPNSKRPEIVCIANFYKTKDLPNLIEAMTLINANLTIIGDGDLRPQLEEQIKNLNLGNKITLVGKITNAQKYLKAFDVFVLSSVKEGLPYVLLEASGAKITIVATNVGGVPEIIHNKINGYLVEPSNPKTFAQTINQALEHPLTPSLFNDYRIETMINDTEKLYNT